MLQTITNFKIVNFAKLVIK